MVIAGWGEAHRNTIGQSQTKHTSEAAHTKTTNQTLTHTPLVTQVLAPSSQILQRQRDLLQRPRGRRDVQKAEDWETKSKTGESGQQRKQQGERERRRERRRPPTPGDSGKPRNGGRPFEGVTKAPTEPSCADPINPTQTFPTPTHPTPTHPIQQLLHQHTLTNHTTHQHIITQHIPPKHFLHKLISPQQFLTQYTPHHLTPPQHPLIQHTPHQHTLPKGRARRLGNEDELDTPTVRGNEERRQPPTIKSREKQPGVIRPTGTLLEVNLIGTKPLTCHSKVTHVLYTLPKHNPPLVIYPTPRTWRLPRNS